MHAIFGQHAVLAVAQAAPIEQCVLVAFAHVKLFHARHRQLGVLFQFHGCAVWQHLFAKLDQAQGAVDRLLLNLFGHLGTHVLANLCVLLLHLFKDAALGV